MELGEYVQATYCDVEGFGEKKTSSKAWLKSLHDGKGTLVSKVFSYASSEDNYKLYCITIGPNQAGLLGQRKKDNTLRFGQACCPKNGD